MFQKSIWLQVTEECILTAKREQRTHTGFLLLGFSSGLVMAIPKSGAVKPIVRSASTVKKHSRLLYERKHFSVFCYLKNQYTYGLMFHINKAILKPLNFDFYDKIACHKKTTNFGKHCRTGK